MTTKTIRYLWLGLFLAAPLMMIPDTALAQGHRRGPPLDSAMRQRIEERFAERVQQALQLSDDQAARLTVTTARYAERRQELRAREQRMRNALTVQLRAAGAADIDSVARLTDDLIELRLGLCERDQLFD